MSLSAYLTRDEWNAAFFVAAHATAEGRIEPKDLSDQLRWGIVLLHRAGMKFQGVAVHGDDPDSVEKVTCIDDPTNARVIIDIAFGGFDGRKRLDEFLAWAEAHPEVDVRATVESIRSQLAEVAK